MPTLPLCLVLLAALPVAAIVPKAQPAKAKAAPQPIHKAKVPVTPTVTLGEGQASLELRFDQPAEEVAIGLRGLDGLMVTWTPPVEQRAFTRGETLHLEVTFTPGPGQSHLALDVEGRFRGQRRAGVFTFAIGKPSPEQQKAGQSGILSTRDGQRIRLMQVKKD